MPSSTTTVSRLLEILCLVQGGSGWTSRKLADRFGVTQRVVYRDVARLRESGVPIDHDADAKGYAIGSSFYLPPVDLTLEESAALMLLGAVAESTDTIPLTRPAARAIEKLRAGMPRAFRRDLNNTLPRVTLGLARCEAEGSTDDAWSTATCAIAERRCLSCVYESVHRPPPASADGEGVFLLQPLDVWWGKRAWYLLGKTEAGPAPRLFKLSRFSRLVLTDTPAPEPEPDALRDFLGQAWRMIPGPRHTVRVRFEPAFAETVADTLWHPTQRVEHLDDGSIRLSVEVDGLDEVLWWVLGYGPHATVEEPAELRRRVATLAAETAARYAEPPGEAGANTP